MPLRKYDQIFRQPKMPLWARCALGVFLGLLACLADEFAPNAIAHSAFLPVLLVVFWGTFFGGTLTGLITAGISLVSTVYFVLPPRHSFHLSTNADIVTTFLYTGISVFLVWLFASLRTAHHKANQEVHKARLNSEISQILVSSLDYENTLNSVARLAVPALADWCVIDVVDVNSNIKRVAAAAASPSKEDLILELQHRYPPTWDSPQPTVVALKNKVSIHVEHYSRELLRRAARDEHHWSLLVRLDPKSIAIVPMIARGRIVGVLGCAHSESGRLYKKEDLEFIEGIAQRMAIAVDNAQLYQEAQSTLHARDEFLAIAAHELKTPLTALNMHLNLLKRLAPDQVSSRGLLQGAESQVDLLAKLVSGILDVSRMPGKQFHLNREKLDICAIVREVVSRMSEEIRRANVSLRLEIEETVEGEWDRVRVEQIVWNLVSNALKYGRGKPVKVRVEVCGEYACIAVSDQGPGIAKEAQNRIFERYERIVGDQTVSGLGLGLFIVRQIVAAHGGRIELQSELGRGSTFTVYLPRSASKKKVKSA